MNLSIYGKTMENIEKRTDVKIVTRWENKRKSLGARGWIARPNFHSSLQFAYEDDDEISNPLLAIQMSKCNVTLNKPIYLGFIVLELSKILMYEFHYDYIKPKYHENALLNYMDTDSFIYNIKTEDFYSDILDDIPLRFDTYDFDPNNQHNIPRLNNKVLGLFKDETCGNKMMEFVGLRAKMYSFTVQNAKSVQKAKGVKRSVTKRLRIDDYKRCLFNKIERYEDMLTFRSKLHTIYTQNLNKLALSFKDTKRFICEDNISTLAWGHKNIPNDNDP